jgi:hypothetical protein
MSKIKPIMFVCALLLLIGGVTLGITTYNNAKANPIENPAQNESGQWVLTFSVKVTAFFRDYSQVYISPTGQDKWSDNLLTQTLRGGQAVTITYDIADENQTYFDIRAVGEDGNEEYFEGVNLGGSGAVFALISAEQSRIKT